MLIATLISNLVLGSTADVSELVAKFISRSASSTYIVNSTMTVENGSQDKSPSVISSETIALNLTDKEWTAKVGAGAKAPVIRGVRYVSGGSESLLKQARADMTKLKMRAKVVFAPQLELLLAQGAADDGVLAGFDELRTSVGSDGTISITGTKLTSDVRADIRLNIESKSSSVFNATMDVTVSGGTIRHRATLKKA